MLTIRHSCKLHWGADALPSSPLFAVTTVKIGMRNSSVARLWVLRAVVSDEWRKGSSCVRLQHFMCVCVTSPCLFVIGQNVYLMIWRWRFRIEIACNIDVIKDGKLWTYRLDQINRGCIPLACFVYTAVKVYSMFGCVISDFRLEVGDICAVAIPYRCFGTTCLSHLQGSRWDL
jgi:hypothetical protein